MRIEMEQDRFWIVWCPAGKSPPSVRHWSRDDADREAERLSRVNAGSQFFVLKCVGGFSADEPVITKIKIVKSDGIPF